MNLVGSGTFWFQTLQGDLNELSWDALVLAVTNKFDKDEQNHLLRQFFHLKHSI
jgi:hypothetical protein